MLAGSKWLPSPVPYGRRGYRSPPSDFEGFGGSLSENKTRFSLSQLL